MTTEQLNTIKELERLGKPDSRPTRADVGICNQPGIYLYYFDNYDILIQRWKYFTGEIVFPIPHPTLTPERAYYKTQNKWTGPYGAKRRALCRYLARKFKKQLKATK